MRILELFSGTASFSRVCRFYGEAAFTVDIDPAFCPDMVADITKLRVADLPEAFQHPDIIWASPPCEQYSRAKSRGIRKLEEADRNLQKTIELIKQLNPKYWFIENPQTGLLKKRQVMSCLGSLFSFPYKDVSYCKYGLPYRKQTRIWTNFHAWKPKAICKKDCDFLVGGIKGKRHIGSAGTGGKGQGHKIKYSNKSYKKEEKYSVPSDLCREILEAIIRGNQENRIIFTTK